MENVGSQFLSLRQFIRIQLSPLGREAADSDEAGHAFQYEAGHPFQFEAGQCAELKPATGGLPRVDWMMFSFSDRVKCTRNGVTARQAGF